MCRLLPFAVLLAWPTLASEFPPAVTTKDIPRLLESTAFVRSLDEAALRRLVPERSGLHFVGCPNCSAGRQENQLEWAAERPGEVYCRFCSHRYPSPKYPMNAAVEVRNPRGETQRYPYWADASGYRYFFEARRDDLVRVYLANTARDLALLYAATGDRAHASRAAVLLDQFARVFPGWCYHYDFPFRQKEIYDGDVPPERFRPNYRTARWHWWAYRDVPIVLVEAYDWIRASGVLDQVSSARIEGDLLRNAAEQVLSNKDDYTNMSPAAWTTLIKAGRVIGEPRYVHEPVRRFRRFMETQFFYDYAWHEGAPSYHRQTTGLLTGVLDALKGCSDPPGYRDPTDGSRFDKLDLQDSFPSLARSIAALNRMRLPDGRAVPVHDTWSTDREAAPAASTSWLLPALGHACLGGGSGEAQRQYHLTWSGGYGHQHADNLSLLLFAHGREKLSDLGYSHTRYRPWTLSSVAHNLVVIDGVNQHSGSLSNPSDGTLRFFDGGGGVQVVSASGERGYPGKASVYRRTLAVIGGAYAVDIFEVEGGSTHDYFLHGEADHPAEVSAPLNFEPLAALLPGGFDWKPSRFESDTAGLSQAWYAYGYLSGLRKAPAPAGTPLPVTFPGLRVTLLPEAASGLVLGRSPSVRQAAEDDAQLGAFSRPFLMLRHEAARSVFVTVMEPFETQPAVAFIERLALDGAVTAVRVRAGRRTDLLIYGAPSGVSIPAGSRSAAFTGELGVLSLEGDRVVRAWALGQGGWTRGSQSLAAASTGRAVLSGITGGEFELSAVKGSLPKPGGVARVITGDGWVYPFTVTRAKPSGNGTARLAVVEGPGLTLSEGTLQLTAYPRRTHSGSVSVEWHVAGRAGGN